MELILKYVVLYKLRECITIPLYNLNLYIYISYELVSIYGKYGQLKESGGKEWNGRKCEAVEVEGVKGWNEMYIPKAIPTH